MADADPGHPGATASPAKESQVSPEEVSGGGGNASGSPTRSGEDVVKDEGKEPGRRDAGTQGESERPVGTSTDRDRTGI